MSSRESAKTHPKLPNCQFHPWDHLPLYTEGAKPEILPEDYVISLPIAPSDNGYTLGPSCPTGTGTSTGAAYQPSGQGRTSA